MKKTLTMQELGMVNEINLCDSCCHEVPICNPTCVIFGTGTGNDNIASCSEYEAIRTRNFEEERFSTLNKI